MPPKTLTSTDRLQLLLPWLNGDLGRDVSRARPARWRVEERRAFDRGADENVQTWIDYQQVRAAVDDFVKSFDGSEGAAHLVAKPTDKVEALSEAALDRLGAALTCLLEQGFGEPMLQGDLCPLVLTGVELAACPAPREKPRWRKATKANPRVVLVGPSGLGAQARRDWLASGAYVLRVRGPLVAVVPYLAAHLLLRAGMVALKRCARRDQPPWADCHKVFVIDPTRRGRPQQFCATSCGRRYKEQEKMMKSRRRRGRKKS